MIYCWFRLPEVAWTEDWIWHLLDNLSHSWGSSFHKVDLLHYSDLWISLNPIIILRHKMAARIEFGLLPLFCLILVHWSYRSMRTIFLWCILRFWVDSLRWIALTIHDSRSKSGRKSNIKMSWWVVRSKYVMMNEGRSDSSAKRVTAT